MPPADHAGGGFLRFLRRGGGGGEEVKDGESSLPPSSLSSSLQAGPPSGPAPARPLPIPVPTARRPHAQAQSSAPGSSSTRSAGSGLFACFGRSGEGGGTLGDRGHGAAGTSTTPPAGRPGGGGLPSGRGRPLLLPSGSPPGGGGGRRRSTSSSATSPARSIASSGISRHPPVGSNAECEVSVRPCFAWSAAVAAGSARGGGGGGSGGGGGVPPLPLPRLPSDKYDCQDEVLVVQGLGGLPGLTLAGVFDGHGRGGRAAATRAAAAVAASLASPAAAAAAASPDRRRRAAAFEAALAAAHLDLVGPAAAADPASAPADHPFSASGTTACLALAAGSWLFTAHVGDSRAVLGRIAEAGVGPGGESGVEPVRLTRDHTPDIEKERQRIGRAGGVVRRPRDARGEATGAYRVYGRSPAAVAAGTPGLAMSRALGDVAAQALGVIPTPELGAHAPGEGDLFAILATDGVWDVVSPSDAVALVAGYRGSTPWAGLSAADALTAEAHERWKARSFEAVVDDVAAVVLWLSEPPPLNCGGAAGGGEAPAPAPRPGLAPAGPPLLLPPPPPGLIPGARSCGAANSEAPILAARAAASTAPPARWFEDALSLGKCDVGGAYGCGRTSGSGGPNAGLFAQQQQQPGGDSSSHGGSDLSGLSVRSHSLDGRSAPPARLGYSPGGTPTAGGGGALSAAAISRGAAGGGGSGGDPAASPPPPPPGGGETLRAGRTRRRPSGRPFARATSPEAADVYFAEDGGGGGGGGGGTGRGGLATTAQSPAGPPALAAHHLPPTPPSPHARPARDFARPTPIPEDRAVAAATRPASQPVPVGSLPRIRKAYPSPGGTSAGGAASSSQEGGGLLSASLGAAGGGGGGGGAGGGAFGRQRAMSLGASGSWLALGRASGGGSGGSLAMLAGSAGSLALSAPSSEDGGGGGLAAAAAAEEAAPSLGGLSLPRDASGRSLSAFRRAASAGSEPPLSPRSAASGESEGRVHGGSLAALVGGGSGSGGLDGPGPLARATSTAASPARPGIAGLPFASPRRVSASGGGPFATLSAAASTAAPVVTGWGGGEGAATGGGGGGGSGHATFGAASAPASGGLWGVLARAASGGDVGGEGEDSGGGDPPGGLPPPPLPPRRR